MDDHELLREYVERQSEPAFAELVARHVDFVYATAWRVMGDSAAAQDVAQAVFIHLARKAWTVRDGRALVGWLYRATYRTALDTRRGEQRRRQRETDAMILTEQNSTSPAAWEKLAPLLDEALQQLSRAEQNAVLLRYFEGKTLRETGAALGTTEDAAQMRVSRALDKMRTHFARHGITVATGALAVALSANTAKAAPAGLTTRVTGTSLAGASGAGLGGAMLRILFMSTKTKTILAVVIVLAVVIGLKFTLWQPAESTTSVKTATNLTASSAPPAAALPTARPPAILPPTTPPAPARNVASSTAVVANPPVNEQVNIDEATVFVTQSIQTPLLSYKLAMGHYPSTEDGLDALVDVPIHDNAASWKGPYFNTTVVPLDPWGHPYEYAFPSIHGQVDGRYDVWSDGPDGINGSADNIGNWEK